jgi:hypothetical protein
MSVGIFSEKSSDFVQDRQPISKVSVSRLAKEAVFAMVNKKKMSPTDLIVTNLSEALIS